MIGGNCPKANEPVEMIQSVGNGPYGKRTRLGWCIVGSIDSYSDSQCLHSNLTMLRGRIPVKDVTTGNIASHVFASNSPAEDPYVDMLNLMNKSLTRLEEKKKDCQWRIEDSFR